MNIHTQRNLEAFVQLVDLRLWRTDAWLGLPDTGVELYLDVVGRPGQPERLRLSVSVSLPDRLLSQALVAVCTNSTPRATEGVPVRFFCSGPRLVGSACLPYGSTARQWLPVYRYLRHRIMGCMREEQ